MAKGKAVGQKTGCKRPPATPAKKPKLAPGKDNTFKKFAGPSAQGVLDPV